MRKIGIFRDSAPASCSNLPLEQHFQLGATGKRQEKAGKSNRRRSWNARGLSHFTPGTSQSLFFQEKQHGKAAEEKFPPAEHLEKAEIPDFPANTGNVLVLASCLTQSDVGNVFQEQKYSSFSNWDKAWPRFNPALTRL